MGHWTQEEAIAFEAARECITDVMAMYSAELADAKKALPVDSDRVEAIRARLTTLSHERDGLRGSDNENIIRVLGVYGAMVREHRTRQKYLAAA
jgi:hypothetical protein